MKKFWTRRKSILNKTVFRLGIVSFFADVSSEMLYPITPIFLTSVLGASMLSVGAIEGVSESIAALLKTFSGFWSDRIRKRRPFISFGYFLAAVAKPVIGFAGSWEWVLFGRALDRTGKGLRGAPRDALISDSVDSRVQGEAFGWHRLMDTLGAAVGPLLAILYLETHADHLRSIYFWALIPGLIAVLVTFSLREAPVEDRASEPRPSLKWRWNPITPSFKYFLFAWAIFSLTNSSDVFLILKAKHEGMSSSTTILMYSFYNVVYAVMSPYLGNLSDRFPRKYVMAGGLFVFSLVYFGFARASVAWHFWSFFGVYGLYMAATDGVGKALAVDLVPAELKATGVGIFGTVTGLSTVVASSVGGYLWDSFGSVATFFYGAVGALIASALLIAWGRIGTSMAE